MDEKYLSLQEAVKLLGVSEGTVRARIAQGDLRAYRLGGKGHMRFLRSEVEALMRPVEPQTKE